MPGIVSCMPSIQFSFVQMGFAFYQGSFQAIETNKRLHEFTVKPAPPGRLEAALEATKINLFAVDLRTISNQPVPDGSGLLKIARIRNRLFR
jgi:hypothetical protein